MERRDVIVAIAGAILLAVATLGVGFSGVGTGLLTYDVVVRDGENAAHAATLGTVEQQTEATFDDSIEVTAPYLEDARLTVRATPTATFVSGAALHVRLVDPHGTVHEDEASVASGGSAFEVVLDIPSSPRPEGGGLEATSEADARAQLAQRLPPAMNGTWTLEVQYASGGAVPDANVELSYVLEYSGWLVDLQPAAAPSR